MIVNIYRYDPKRFYPIYPLIMLQGNFPLYGGATKKGQSSLVFLYLEYPKTFQKHPLCPTPCGGFSPKSFAEGVLAVLRLTRWMPPRGRLRIRPFLSRKIVFTVCEPRFFSRIYLRTPVFLEKYGGFYLRTHIFLEKHGLVYLRNFVFLEK